MVYSLSQIYSKENERLLRQNNPEYENFKIEKEKENREFLKKN